jgi:hypothetical protein
MRGGANGVLMEQAIPFRFPGARADACSAVGRKRGDSVLASGRARLGNMGRRSPLNLNSLLAAVEAVDVLAAALAEAIGAYEVSFLIADAR